MKIKYYLMNPTGNITLLVETPVEEAVQPEIAARLMELEPTAEQVGFLNRNSLRMAGGEFCGNASMSAAALLCRDLKCGENRKIELDVSGADEKVYVEITAEDKDFKGTVSMPKPQSVEDISLTFSGENYSTTAVKFKGITHLVFGSDFDKETAEKAAPEWCAELNADALGIMLLDKDNSRLEPLVYVPNAGTMFWESSCASGTSAVGAFLYAKEKRPVKQTFSEPGGKLTVEADGEKLLLTGCVEILKYSQIEI